MTKKKKEGNKGFTLVELIVVIVILAILAAILVPALLGYIDRAKNQQSLLDAKSCYTAAQAELSSMYGRDEAPSKITEPSHKDSILNTADVAAKCETLIIGVIDADNSKLEHQDYTVAYVEYKETGKEPIFFDGKSWVDTKPTGITNLVKYAIKGVESAD